MHAIALVREQPVLLLAAGAALLDHLDRGGRHLARVTPHDLPGKRVILRPAGHIVFEFAKIGLGKAASACEKRAVQQRLGDAEGTPMPPRDDAHRRIGISRQSGLKERGIEPRHQGSHARIDGAASALPTPVA
jgi:hypothetical protein